MIPQPVRSVFSGGGMSRNTTLLTLALLLSAAGFGQNGSIQGIVTDAAGASVPNAQVRAFDIHKSVIVRETNTSREGAFILAPLLPGRYNVKVEAQGFKVYEANELTLD